VPLQYQSTLEIYIKIYIDDTKMVTRTHKSKDRRQNGQKKKDESTKNDKKKKNIAQITSLKPHALKQLFLSSKL
jgi:hypothetical protein